MLYIDVVFFSFIVWCLVLILADDDDGRLDNDNNVEVNVEVKQSELTVRSDLDTTVDDDAASHDQYDASQSETSSSPDLQDKEAPLLVEKLSRDLALNLSSSDEDVWREENEEGLFNKSCEMNIFHPISFTQ